MDIFFLLFMLIRPVLFVTLFLTAFRDKLRLPLGWFVAVLVLIQLGFYLAITASYGGEDPAVLLYLNSFLNAAVCVAAVRVPWDMAVSCVMLTGPWVLLSQSASLLMGNLAPKGMSPYLVNFTTLAGLYGMVVYPAMLLVKRVKQYIWIDNQDVVNRRYFLMAMTLMLIAAIGLRDFSTDRSWHMLVGRILIFGAVFYIFFLCFSLVEKAKANQELHNDLKVLDNIRKTQREYYHKLVENCESTQRLQHDIRHHGLAMKSYLDQGEYEKLAEYLDKYLLLLDEQLKPVLLCGNQIVDGITGYWQQRFRREGLAYSGKITVGRLYIRDIDMAIVLGNLLENAFEAMMELSQRQPEKSLPPLELKLVTKGDMLLLSVKNPCLGHAFETEEGYLSAKRDFAAPGMGLQNIKIIVDNYQGYLKVNQEEGSFQVQLMLKNITTQ